MTIEQTAAAIAILRDAYPRQPFPDDSVTFYAHKLRDIPSHELVAAIDRLTNRLTFLPSVAEICKDVAEARLQLPDASEAWLLAEKGPLREAPAAVREAAEAVGGRWAIMHSDNPVATRAQFRKAYEERREQAVLEESGALPPRPELGPLDREALPAGLPDRIGPPTVLQREIRRMVGEQLDPPTEEEIRDAIAILRPGPLTDDPADDSLYKAAELVLVHADEATKETI